MNNLHKIFFLIGFGILISSCHKSENNIIPLRDYSNQYTADLATIQNYLKTHTMTAPDANMDVVFGVTTDQSASIWGPSATHGSNILERMVYSNGFNYTIYYIKFRQGTGSSPCNVDKVFAAYSGRLIDNPSSGLDGTGTVFDFNNNPSGFFNLETVIRGWSEIFPQFNSGTYVTNSNGTSSYDNFGAGVMFIPSGLAYYAGGSGSIPSYTPLLFTFKLYDIQRQDQDSDGIYSFQEDINHDGYVYSTVESGINVDDTDGDGFPDYLDRDDDGDRVLTRVEIKDPATGLLFDYSVIPDCSGNVTDPNRKRKYLDATCH